MSENENMLLNLAIGFCQADMVDKPTILRVLDMNKEQQAQFLGYVGAWCAGANSRIEKKKAK